jgi:cold-inducible RNA-binding protein
MNIYVGNLSWNTNEQDLQEAFEAFGEVSSVSIITDRETGKSRGFGFVEMPSDAEARAAIAALNGADMGGRNLTVNEARPREDRGDRGGGGARRDFGCRGPSSGGRSSDRGGRR